MSPRLQRDIRLLQHFGSYFEVAKQSPWIARSDARMTSNAKVTKYLTLKSETPKSSTTPQRNLIESRAEGGMQESSGTVSNAAILCEHVTLQRFHFRVQFGLKWTSVAPSDAGIALILKRINKREEWAVPLSKILLSYY
jgi:hypothetical protein